jgi:hypothetical protein
MKIGSFNPAIAGGETISVPAIIFGYFAVHSSVGRTVSPKGKQRDTRGMIALSHCPTGMSMAFFNDLMSAVYLAEELDKSVPAELASSTDKDSLYKTLGEYYRRATLAVIGRDVGKGLDLFSGIRPETPA